MQMGLPYLPGKPQYRSLTTKQSKKFQVQARWKEKFRRLLGREEKIQPVESDSEVTKADGIEGEPVAPPEKIDPQSEKFDPQSEKIDPQVQAQKALDHILEHLELMKENVVKAINSNSGLKLYLAKFLVQKLNPLKNKRGTKEAACVKDEKREGEGTYQADKFAIEMAVGVAKVVVSHMRDVARSMAEPEDQFPENLQEVKCPGAHENAQRNRIKMPDHQLQPISKERAVGKRVFFDRDPQLGYKHGIWDGDAVICNVMEQRCTCRHCVAAADFNSTYVPKFKKGDHIYAECEPNYFGNRMYHHGIYDGKGYVYHFAASKPKLDCDFEKCEECRARGIRRRENLKSRGLGPSGIRKSCLYCFAEKDCIDKKRRDSTPANTTIENQEPYISRIDYGVDLQQWRASKAPLSPIVCKNFKHRGADKVVQQARTFYEDDSFGKYSEKHKGMSHNCESFAYYCKTGIYASHQVTEELFRLLALNDTLTKDNSSTIDSSTIDSTMVDSTTEEFIRNLFFLLVTKVFLYVRGIDKIDLAKKKAEKANKACPTEMPEALVPAELYELRE
ncbi:hypothetical protein KC19_10G134900 [Ceratodon purpureus]|uniref:LRAT domain-containing protein n=1 Tax=Ceratodon purpureus TaxID=3225 RepID=A0A8T0GNP1_CERPU|nr:hypothetical protein KC19_10G134900 [Ceratodon purpureus]